MSRDGAVTLARISNCHLAREEPADAEVAASLHQRAVGFEGPDGRYYPPEPKAVAFWLGNRQREKWAERVEVQHAGTIEHLHSLSPAERLARAEQLLVDAERYLPLLEQAEAELEAAHDDGAVEVPSTESGCPGRGAPT